MRWVHIIRFLAVVLPLAVVAPLGVAHADSSLRGDPRGDVMVVSDGVPDRAATRNRYADITRSRVTHDRARVRFVVRVRSLRRRDFNLNASIRTPEAPFLFNLARYKGIDQALLLNAEGDPIQCEGQRHAISFGRNVLSFSLPRTCLGRPTWVRTGASLSVVGSSGEFDHLDFSHRRGTRGTVTSIPVGPRVRR